MCLHLTHATYVVPIETAIEIKAYRSQRATQKSQCKSLQWTSLPEYLQESLPLVGRLSNANFAQYERTHLPMLIMFLELPGE